MNRPTTPTRWLRPLALAAVVATPFTALAEISEEDALHAMGYAMARQLRLDIGFSEEQINRIFVGMRALAAGDPEPEGLMEALQVAQGIYMEKMQVAREREEAERAVQGEANKAASEAFLAELDGESDVEHSASGLRYRIQETGEGDRPSARDTVVVNYVGTLTDGREFDRGDGVEFGLNRVVPGFSEGLQLLAPGGKATLYIPADLGYGDTPRPGGIIEPGHALIFHVELVEVRAAAERPPTPRRPSVTTPPAGGPPGGPPGGVPPRPPGPPPNFTPPPPPSGPPPSPPPAPPPPRPSNN